jgi:hypothetical protein
MNEPVISFLEWRTKTGGESGRSLGVALQFGGTEGPIRDSRASAAARFEPQTAILIEWPREVSFTKQLQLSSPG